MSSAPFVEQLYKQILLREPTVGEVQYWATTIDMGLFTAPQLTNYFLDSIEFKSFIKPIFNLYVAAFGRNPDAAGLESWVSLYKAQGSTPQALASIAAMFTQSSEFTANPVNQSTPTAQFIDQLYMNAVDRHPSAAEISYYLNAANNGVSTGQLLYYFSQSAEMINRTSETIKVVMAYQGILNQIPTQAQIDAAIASHDITTTINNLYASVSYTGEDIPGVSTHTWHSNPNGGLSINGISSITTVDMDNNHSYSAYDTLSLNFLTAIDIDSFSLADLTVTNGHHLGNGATLVAVNPINGFATEFKIVLGESTNITNADSLTIAKGGITYQGNRPSTVIEVFEIPQVETTPATAQSITASDRNANGAYSINDTLTINFSEPVSTAINFSNLSVTGGHSFGVGATLIPIYAQNGYATEFRITLGGSPTIGASDVISVANLAVVDQSGNVATSNTTFTVPALPTPMPPADTTGPMLSTSFPTDNETGVAVAANIVLIFDENISAGTGNIIITDGSDTRTISIADPQINITGNTLTINPTSDLLPNSTYNVQMASGVLVDATGNAYAGITNATSLDFDTVSTDITPPTALAFTMTTTTVGATSDEAGTLGLYDPTLFGSPAAFTSPSGLTTNLTPTAQGSVVFATLRVADTAGNFAVATQSVILGTNAQDSIVGTTGDDFIFGFDSDDDLSGGNGNDVLSGGAGADQIWVDSGSNTLVFNASAGNSSDSNLSSRDTVYDLTPNDLIQIYATEVNSFDVLSDVQQIGVFYIASFNGSWAGIGDIVFTNYGWNSLSYGNADAQARTIVHITGTTADDSIEGGANNDTVIGASGNDVISGGEGADLMTGGIGIDTFRTGNRDDSEAPTAVSDSNNNDTFDTGDVYTFADGVDLITDFETTDLLDTNATPSVEPTSLNGMGYGWSVGGQTITGTAYVAYGTYDNALKTFTVATGFNASSANDALVTNGDGLAWLESINGFVVLENIGVALNGTNFS